MALVKNKATLMVSDVDAPDKLVYRAIELMHDQQLKNTLGGNCAKMALPNAASRIVDEIFNLVSKSERIE